MNRKQTLSSNGKILCLSLLLCAALLGVPTLMQAQNVITTVAGGGPDGVPAVSANLSGPVGVATDSLGNMFIAAVGGGRVFQVDAAGQLTVAAGNGVGGFSGDGGPATSASLRFPEGVAVDGSGNLFIADRENQRIRQVAPGP